MEWERADEACFPTVVLGTAWRQGGHGPSKTGGSIFHAWGGALRASNEKHLCVPAQGIAIKDHVFCRYIRPCVSGLIPVSATDQVETYLGDRLV